MKIGNDHDEDSDKEPEPPTKVIDKTPARTTKRNATGEAPATKAPVASEGRGTRRGNFNGNEGGSYILGLVSALKLLADQCV